MPDANTLIAQTRAWLEQVVIAENFCPFAKQPLQHGQVYFDVSSAQDIENCLHDILCACQKLDRQPDIETTLLILAGCCGDFYDFLRLIELANALLVEQHYEGVYQLAHFHPEYCFAGEVESDAANYTNRSPYPIIHILREASVELRLAHCIHPEEIPETNIAHARSRGNEYFMALLQRIRDMR